MWRTILITAAILVSVIVMAIRFYRNPDLQAGTTHEKVHIDERPYDENNYPVHQVVRTPKPVELFAYFRFMDSLTGIRQELRGLDMPGDRIIALANTWIIDSLAAAAVRGHVGVVIPSGARINIPDTVTAKWINTTIRKNKIIIDLGESRCYVTSGTDTIFKASIIQPPEGLDPQGIQGDTILASVIALHRATHFGQQELEYAKLPCLETHTAEGPVFLIGSAPKGWNHTARNFIHVSPADVWMIYHLAPPGTTVKLIKELEKDRQAIRRPRIGK